MFEQLMLANVDDNIIPVVAIAGGLAVGAVAIAGGILQSISTTKQREHTRREIAAYIAEGTMTPDEGEKIIKAGLPRRER